MPALEVFPSPAKGQPTCCGGFSTCGFLFRLTFFFSDFHFRCFNQRIEQLMKQCFFFHLFVYNDCRAQMLPPGLEVITKIP